MAAAASSSSGFLDDNASSAPDMALAATALRVCRPRHHHRAKLWQKNASSPTSDMGSFGGGQHTLVQASTKGSRSAPIQSLENTPRNTNCLVARSEEPAAASPTSNHLQPLMPHL
eukprot:Protomagalhaensia_wolfi_Nauph_80__5837@NODE_738_length_2050_cov_44_854301_g552_i0_p4_GENE_NODE_738_length_2050_cov_44_854301_g552_i0NODE_738_length_2050_cov_44_854301_g552_i0_p4_ORF_typecomplete_len115_score18_74_NODE_738_length_2050_cov_44_854301_g552_i012671611